jgi:hypothetical protein
LPLKTLGATGAPCEIEAMDSGAALPAGTAPPSDAAASVRSPALRRSNAS